MKPSCPGYLFAVCTLFLNYRFCFISSDQSIQIICFLLTQFMQTVSLDTCPFLLGCVICWHIVHSIFLWFFFFCISAVLLLILYIWVFSFLCVNLGRGLLILFILSSNQLIDSLIFYCCCCCFLSLCFYFLSGIYYFFPSANFKFWMFFFSNYFKW